MESISVGKELLVDCTDMLLFLVIGSITRQCAKCLTVDDSVLSPIETAVRNVLTQWSGDSVLDLDKVDRETFGVAKHLNNRLQGFQRNHDCRRCWLQKAHCICSDCPPLEEDNHLSTSPLVAASIRRIYVLMHHKEICLVHDTAKLIPASFPVSCRVVVGGIGPTFQSSLQEMLDSLHREASSCMILFPSDQAQRYADIQHEIEIGNVSVPENGWNIIVIDGTWDHARRLQNPYLVPAFAGRQAADMPLLVKLSEPSLASLLVAKGTDNSISRGISTYGALRLFRASQLGCSQAVGSSPQVTSIKQRV